MKLIDIIFFGAAAYGLKKYWPQLQAQVGTLPADGSSSNPSGPTGPSGSGSVGTRAQMDLAQRLGVATGNIRIVSIVAAEFSDATLGCGGSGIVGAQVITPGYRITLADATNRQYEYRADLAGNLRTC